MFTIRAYTGWPAAFRCSRQYAVASRVVTKCPRRCTRMTRSHSSGDMVNTIRSRSTPALFTRMSSRPYCSSAVASSFSPVDHSATSPAATTACPPSAAISSATACTSSPGRSLSTSRAPARARASDSARPSPFPAPVTMATRPAIASASSIPPVSPSQ